MRRLGIVLVGLLTIGALHQFVLVPWLCNWVSKDMEAALHAALGGNQAAQTYLSDNLAKAEACRARVPADVNLNISVASTHAMLGRPDEALRVYEAALRYDRRPEMYFNRAGIKLGQGDAAGALDDFVYAGRFNQQILDRVRNQAMLARILAELARIRAAGHR